MEALYARLYDKYIKLRARNNAELDQFSHEQEEKFMNYVSTAEEVIEHLRSENNRLKAQINDLQNEVSSVRSEKVELHAKYENLLLEEAQKTKELSEEVMRLQTLQQEGHCCSSKQGNNDNGQLGSLPAVAVAQVGSQGTSKGSSRKKRYLQNFESQTHEGNPLKLSLVTELERDLCRGSQSDSTENIQQTSCCMTKTASSGDCLSASCLFQTLMEWLVGLKFASVSEAEGLCLSASHQSSGYSFSLTWVSKATGEEAELLYHVASLGTFERVAPGWMKEDLMFSTSMCPVFFKRVSQVIGLQY